MLGIEGTGLLRLALKHKRGCEYMKLKRWNQQEITYLQKTFRSMNHNEIAKNLGRTTRAIRHKASRLKLIKQKRVKRNTPIVMGPALSYVIGVTHGDGTLDRWLHQLIVKDEDFALAFAKNLAIASGRKEAYTVHLLSSDFRWKERDNKVP